MITALKIISFVGLGLTIIPSILVLMGEMDLNTNKKLMAAGMIMWFVGAYFWIYRKIPDSRNQIPDSRNQIPNSKNQIPITKHENRNTE